MRPLFTLLCSYAAAAAAPTAAVGHRAAQLLEDCWRPLFPSLLPSCRYRPTLGFLPTVVPTGCHQRVLSCNTLPLLHPEAVTPLLNVPHGPMLRFPHDCILSQLVLDSCCSIAARNQCSGLLTLAALAVCCCCLEPTSRSARSQLPVPPSIPPILSACQSAPPFLPAPPHSFLPAPDMTYKYI